MESYFYFLISMLMAILPIYHSATSADEIFSYKDNKLYLVEGAADAITNLANEVNNLNTTINYSGTNYSLYFVVPPAYVADFEGFVLENKLKKTIISEDYQAYINNEKGVLGGPFSWTAYFGVDDIQAFVRNVSARHSAAATVVEAGRSYEGRRLLGLRINTGGEGKPAFFIESGIHSREWIAPAVATYFINQLLTSSDPDIVAMREQFDWHIFPVVNPDGYQYSYDTDRFWRKSRSLSPSGCHGVDLNRNWDTENWLVYSASNDSCDYYNYAGTAPFSEPETRSLSQYAANVTNLQAYVSMHSDLDMLLFPYSGSDERVSNYDDLIKIGNSSLAYGFRVNGAQYDGPATAGEISYKSSGESMDWARRSLNVSIAYTYELRGDLFDWPPEKIYQQGDEFTQMILGLVTEARKLGYFKNSAECDAVSAA